MNLRVPFQSFMCAAILLLSCGNGWAFSHTVMPGETLASLAIHYYGTPQMERILVVASGLDRSGPDALVPGMMLEIPAPRYHRVKPGETWATLAAQFLGHEKRSTTLASTNDSEPWIPPETGRVVTIPYNLSWVLTGEESLQTLAYRYMGSNKFAWELMQYNLLTKPELPRGRVLLIPLKDLRLTPQGMDAARAGSQELSGEGAEEQLAQNEAHTALLELKAQIKAGLYVHALRRLGELRGRRAGSLPQKAEIARLELEVLVALDALGPAKEACSTLREADPSFRFDPVLTSPKILRACPEPQPTRAP
jgi:hypothetical protein